MERRATLTTFFLSKVEGACYREFMILFSFLLPEASDVCGPVISLGALPDHMIHLNAARPMLSFSHSQKVLFSKSQS